jgi:hypothetical protein
MKQNITNITFEELAKFKGQIMHITMLDIIKREDGNIDLKFNIVEINADCSIKNIKYIKRGKR